MFKFALTIRHGTKVIRFLHTQSLRRICDTRARNSSYIPINHLSYTRKGTHFHIFESLFSCSYRNNACENDNSFVFVTIKIYVHYLVVCLYCKCPRKFTLILITSKNVFFIIGFSICCFYIYGL